MAQVLARDVHGMARALGNGRAVGPGTTVSCESIDVQRTVPMPLHDAATDSRSAAATTP
jgi:hypothetical protein